MRNKGNCYLCGAIATTWDHIPQKSLFTKHSQNKGIKVPACAICNNHTSKDDEYLRDTFVITGQNEAAKKVFYTTLMPSFMRDYERLKMIPKIQRVRQSMAKVNVQTQNGVFLRQSPALKVDMVRVNKSLEKIVRGLYFHHNGTPVPMDYLVRVFFEPPNSLSSSIRDIIVEAQAIGKLQQAMFDDVFLYEYVQPEEDKYVSFWRLVFYQTHEAIILIDKIT